MADNDRYRSEQDRYRDRGGYDRDRGGSMRGRDDIYGRSNDYGHRDDDGMIARRGFGNPSAGYDRGQDSRHDRGYDDRFERGRERDFGDSAGYGSGGSTRDWRDVMGEDRGRYSQGYGAGRMGYDRERSGGYGTGSSYFGNDERSRFGGSSDYERNRYGASDFGRGSRGDDDDRGFFERAGDEIRSWFGDDDAERRRMRDAREGDQGAQHHRGRGPKNYMRSDDRIREDVSDRLTDDPHVDASEIEVSVENREVTLSGTVDSRYEKRRAEDVAEAISGVTHVQNNLRVKARSEVGSPPTSFASANDSMGSERGPASGSGASQSTGSVPIQSTAQRRRSTSTSST